MKLFERFDESYLINLSKRHDRLNKFDNEVIKYDLGDYSKFVAIDGNKVKEKYNTILLPGELGVILSNIEVLKDATKKGHKKILIMEDDCYFSDEVRSIDKFFEKLPSDWDMLYFGGNHNTHIGEKKPKIINDKVLKLHNTYSAHFVVIKSDIFEQLIFLLSMYNKQLDVVYSEIQKTHNVYCFYPAIAKQRKDFSDIQNKEMDYNWLIK